MNAKTGGLTPEAFLERYGRFFNVKRMEGIRDLGFLFTEGWSEGSRFQDDGQGDRFLDMWSTDRPQTRLTPGTAPPRSPFRNP